MKPTLTLIIALVFAPLVSPTLAQSNDGRTITLADDGRARYRIVAASDADGIEDYAAQTLAGYLKEMTGAEFSVVSPDEFKVDRPAIFVGLSEPALARLGPERSLANLRDQEHVARSVGQDILLYGKGHRASLDAVMEFLENSLGWRWYSPFEKPVVPEAGDVDVKTVLSATRFRLRVASTGGALRRRFLPAAQCQHGLGDEAAQSRSDGPGHLGSWLPNENFVHTSFAYIPPDAKRQMRERISLGRETQLLRDQPRILFPWRIRQRGSEPATLLQPPRSARRTDSSGAAADRTLWATAAHHDRRCRHAGTILPLRRLRRAGAALSDSRRPAV